MQTLEYSGLKIKLDDEGYLLNINEWNDKVACAPAEKEGAGYWSNYGYSVDGTIQRGTDYSLDLGESRKLKRKGEVEC